MNAAPSFLAYCGSVAAIAGVVWLVFDRLEALASKPARTSLTAWLTRASLSPRLQRWPETLVRTFDMLFGERHLSWKCFFRSCIASITAIVLLLSITFAADTRLFALLYRIFDPELPSEIRMLLISMTVGTLIPNYISLLQTRFMLRFMEAKQSMFWQFGLLLSDFVLTTLLARFSVIFVFTVAMISVSAALNADVSFTALAGEWRRQLSGIMLNPHYIPGVLSLRAGISPSGQIEVSTGPWFYASYVTSVWIWLYLAAGVCIRGATRFDRLTIRLRWLLDIKRQPFRCLGAVSAALIVLVSLLLWPLLN